MSGKRTPGLRRRGKQGIWSIQKTIRVRGKSIRLCETTGTRSLEAAERYLAKRIEELRFFRFHDLRHTFGHRLRAVGTPLEDRKALLGHTSDEITTHYSAAELGTLLKWVEKVVDASPSTALRTGWTDNVVELRQKRGKLTSVYAEVE